MIRVAVTGPPGMLRTGLESLVRSHPEFDLTLVVDSMEEIGVQTADVVVALEADLDAPGDHPSVVLIWPQMETARLRAALKAGVRAVLPQDCTYDELTAAVQAAAAGLSAMRGSDLEALMLPVATEIRSEAGPALSPRELDVLRLLADGLANKEIGYRLGISEHTVKFHVNSILTRLDAASRAEAVAIGIRQGLILL